MTHRFNPTVLREYDIRGIVGDTLTEADAYALGRTFAALALDEGARRIAVGRDGRTHSGMLEAALVRGLTEGGADVMLTGMGPSPMLYFATYYLDVDGGIQVTGSHNPADYNGFKLLLKGRSVFGKEIQGIGERAAAGDWDRIGAVDGKGRVIWGDQLMLILAEPVLKALPGATIIADVKASQVLFDGIAALGGEPLMWKTGHSLIKSKMKETGAPLAGEMSGHIFFKHRWYGFDDALYAAVRLIEAVSQSGKSLTEIMDAMPKTTATPEMRFQVDEVRKFAIVEEVRNRLAADGAKVDATDGVRVNTADGWWLLRASNTQDVLVARAEAADQPALDRLIAQIDDQLAKSGVERVEAAH